MTSFNHFQNQKSGDHVYDQDVLDEAMELENIWADIKTNASGNTTSTYVESLSSATSDIDGESSYEEVLPNVFRCNGKGKRAVLCPCTAFTSQNHSLEDSDYESTDSILVEKIQISPKSSGSQLVPDGILKTKDSLANREVQVRNIISCQDVTRSYGDDRLITPKPLFMTNESFDDLKEQGGKFFSFQSLATTKDFSPPPPGPFLCTKDSFDDLKEQSDNFLSCRAASSKQFPFNPSRNISLLETHSESMISIYDAEEETSFPAANAASKDPGRICTVRDATNKAFIFGPALGLMMDSMSEKADHFTGELIIDDLSSKSSSSDDAGTEDKRVVRQQPCPYQETKYNSYVVPPHNEKTNAFLCTADVRLIETDDGNVELSLSPDYQQKENMHTTKVADRAKLDQSSSAGGDSKAEELTSGIDDGSCSVFIFESIGFTDVNKVDMKNGCVEQSLSRGSYELSLERIPAVSKIPLDGESYDTQITAAPNKSHLSLSELQAEKLAQKEEVRSTALTALSPLSTAEVWGQDHEPVEFSMTVAELHILERLVDPNAYTNLQRIHSQDLGHNICSTQEYNFPLSPAAALLQPFSPRSARIGAQSANIFSLEIPIDQFGHEEPASRSPSIPPCAISQGKGKGLFTGKSLFCAASDVFHLTSNKTQALREAKPVKEFLDMRSEFCGVDESMVFQNLVDIHSGDENKAESTEIRPNTVLQALLDNNGNKKKRPRPPEWTTDELNKIAADLLHFDLVAFESKGVENNWLSEPQWNIPETLLFYAAQHQYRKISLPGSRSFRTDEKLMTDTTNERVVVASQAQRSVFQKVDEGNGAWHECVPSYRAQQDSMDNRDVKALEFAPDCRSHSTQQPKHCDVKVVRQEIDELSDQR